MIDPIDERLAEAGIVLLPWQRKFLGDLLESDGPVQLEGRRGEHMALWRAANAVMQSVDPLDPPLTL